jgi:hypothetical protein
MQHIHACVPYACICIRDRERERERERDVMWTVERVKREIEDSSLAPRTREMLADEVDRSI